MPERIPKRWKKLDASIAINAEIAQVWFERGKVLDRLGKYEEATSSFDRAKQLNPRYQVSFSDRFPFTMIKKYATLVVLVCGFGLLGLYIYFSERNRQ